MSDVKGNEELQNRILIVEKENQSLKKENKIFSSALENSPAIIVITDKNGNIEYANPQFEKITGYELSEVSGVSIGILKSGIHPTEFYQDLWKCISSGKVWRGEFYNRKKNGDYYWEQANIAPIKDDNDEIINYVAIKLDITKQKQAENQLKDQIQSKDKLLSIISHDLKSPFGSVAGLTDIVIENFTNYAPEEILKIFQLVNSSARFALDLLENLLNLGRSQTGKITASPTLFYLSQLVQETANSVEGQAINKGIIVKIMVDETIKVNADSNWTKIVLRNLLSNAIKFTHPSGKVDILAKEVENFITITVVDNGVGISPQDISKLFLLDMKYTTLGTSNEKGTGLGLLLCKEFIERQGGKIWVESQLGEGSKFTFTLPKN